jgi:AcrR family transcriptional regulator
MSVSGLSAPCPRSARKAKGDGHLRRAEILEAAEVIFVAQGYEGATIRKIAEEVGVSSTALYMHFTDKDQILTEICTRAMEQLLAINSQISALRIDPVARVRMILEAYVGFALDNPNAYRLVFCSPPHSEPSARQKATATIGAECFERFCGVLRELAAEGRLRCGDVDMAARALWAACHGMVTLMIARPGKDWPPRDDFMKVMIDGLLFGLVAD